MRGSYLQRLPAELRNQIYIYALVQAEAIDMDTMIVPGRRWWESGTKEGVKIAEAVQQPALTRTCRAIRAESLPVFYGLNTFKGGLRGMCSSDTYWTTKWLTATGPSKRHLLQDFRVECLSSITVGGTVDMLKNAVIAHWVKKFEVSCSHPHYTGWNNAKICFPEDEMSLTWLRKAKEDWRRRRKLGAWKGSQQRIGNR